MSVHHEAIAGLAAGVPFVALPPDGGPGPAEEPPLIVAWHLNAPPRSAAAMAAALPLTGLSAWRAYLDLPMHGRRQLPGGLEEFMRLGYDDAVLHAFAPQVDQAVAEFPPALAALRQRLGIAERPIGLLGASIGALPALLVMAQGRVPVSAAALISPAIQLTEVVAANERRYGVTYDWSDASRAIATRFDLVARSAEIASADPQPAVLMITGANDDPVFARQTQALQAALHERYGDPHRVSIQSVPEMGHAFAEEPGIEPAAQTPAARFLDTTVTDWFIRHPR
ncbi:MAG: alpha/beta hydrolase family protein [Solirubrobacteraceae bacterium]